MAKKEDASVTKLKAIGRIYIQTLGWYANANNWTHDGKAAVPGQSQRYVPTLDFGERARRALQDAEIVGSE